MPFDGALYTPQRTGLRPVSLADPAWFGAGPRRLADGAPNPDYGCVFFSRWAGFTAYSFDRQGLNLARRIPDGPTSGTVEIQGRLFRIAGPVDAPRTGAVAGAVTGIAAVAA